MSGETTGIVPQVLEAPKRPRRKILIEAVLLIALVGVACMVGFAWWLSPKDEQEPSASSPTGFNTFSKYGLSFEYPKGMSISESEIYESTATNSSGWVLGELINDEYEEVRVGWFSPLELLDTDFPVTSVKVNLTVTLISEFRRLEANGFDVDPGQLVNSTIAGHTIMYEYFNATKEGVVWYCISGVWYCDITTRMFPLIVYYSEQDVLPKFQQYLDSFICH